MGKIVGFVVIGLIALVLGRLAVGWVQQSQERSNRIHCAANLRSLGMAMKLYADKNRNAYPRGPFDPDKPPVFGTPYAVRADLGPAGDEAGVDQFKPWPENKYAPDPNDVTAALLLLMRSEDITSEVFVCRSSGQQRWDFGGGRFNALHWTNFDGKRGVAANLSYSMHNPYAHPAAMGARWDTTLWDKFVLLSDMNPGGPAVLKVDHQSPPAERQQANSLNHGRMGQNVLFGDYHVEMCGSPLVGPMGDNIFTAGLPGWGTVQVVASPTMGGDCVLLPTAEWAGITATQAQLDRRKMSGE